MTMVIHPLDARTRTQIINSSSAPFSTFVAMANFTCPDSDPGSWHSCADESQFVGCCTTDPCELGCSAGNLIAASFNLDLYGTIPDLECARGAQFYTCNSTTPPFWGCCKSNPCNQNGCPDADLSAANLGINPQAPAFYSPTGTASPSASSTPHDSHPSSAVIGGAVGGAVGCSILLGVLVFFLCRRRKRRSHQKYGEAYAGIPEAPPAYSNEISAPNKQSEAAVPIFELDSRMQPPVELSAEPIVPVELDARPASSLLSPPLSPSPSQSSARARKSKRFTGSSLSSMSEERQHTLDALLGAGGSPEVSPQSATFAEGGGSGSVSRRYSAVSSLASTPRVPATPHLSRTINEGDAPTDEREG